MILGYNTNGFAHHRLADAVEIIRAFGYGGVAYTPDHQHPEHEPHGFAFRNFRAGGLQHCVIETGARFILDAWQKHQPTLLSFGLANRERLDYLRGCVDLAAGVGAECVSFWSGTPLTNEPRVVLMSRLVDACRQLANYAAGRNVRLAFEPEPGMFIDTMSKFAELYARVSHPAFGLTLDVGHLVCLGETPIGDHIRRWKDWLWNVHLDDMRPGVHDHLMFGEGVVDFADVFAALREIGYAGMASVELSRHSHDAVNTARRSIEFLRRFI